MSEGEATDDKPGENPAPVLSLPLATASFVAVVVIVTLLIALLFRETTGPGEVLHEYHAAIAQGDCSTAYELLAPQAQGETSQDTFCEFITDEGKVAGDFTIQMILLRGERGDSAEVTAEYPDGTEASWMLVQDGDAWRIREVVPLQPLPRDAAATPSA
ncbi:MAG: hypothetical protein WD757_02020 [Actinomycetota bacterium]